MLFMDWIGLDWIVSGKIDPCPTMENASRTGAVESISGVSCIAGTRGNSVVVDAVGCNMTSSVVHCTLVACANVIGSCLSIHVYSSLHVIFYTRCTVTYLNECSSTV